MATLNKIAASLAAAAALAIPGMAQAIVIDGIDVGNGVLTFVASTIMEERVGGGIITGNGQTLRGVGTVSEIRSDGVLVWDSSVGNELTFQFDNYVSQGFTASVVGFTGGTVKFWHDVSGEAGGFVAANYVTGAGFGADGDATPWLDLVGVTFNDPLNAGSCTGVTLCGTGVLTGSVTITGTGLLAVTGAGLADAHFDTNGTPAAGTGNLADFEIGSQANNQFPQGFIMGTHGTASISNIRAVPEPATLALMGLGLLGIGYSGRMRNRRAK